MYTNVQVDTSNVRVDTSVRSAIKLGSYPTAQSTQLRGFRKRTFREHIFLRVFFKVTCEESSEGVEVGCTSVTKLTWGLS